ncbi:hypothetical protein NKG99_20405 [Mesorhizobium sp. M1409]|uniref:hypothetical protein n=1 Tax=Mesorhizobium sp. M1409 TaxID=2957100 RepID=UPI00333DAEAE
MGSSGSSNYPEPNIPAPPASTIAPQGQTAPFTPNFVNFLPTDPTRMATGLTPEMVQAIMASAQRPVPPPQSPALPVAAQNRNKLAQTMSGSRGGSQQPWARERGGGSR